MHKSARDKFLELSLESTRKSYYPQLKRQLETAKDKERHLQLLIDSLPARISYVNKEERYVFVNRGYEKAFKLKRRQIVGRRVKDVLGDENYSKAKRYINDALRGQHVHYERSFADDKGGSRWLSVTYVPDINVDGAVNGFYVLTLDLTEKRQAEEEKRKLEAKLRQVQKFEAIGTLAGGIAHDFNNLLMGIQGRSSLISADLDPNHRHVEHLKAIEDYIRSAVNLTKQLLGFARGGKYEVKPIDINDLLKSSAHMFGRTRKEIKINIKTDQPSSVVEADHGQLEQVLLNMYVNAWQAMPAGGELYLHSGIVTLDDAFCKSHDIDPGSYVEISVVDTGIGMDESTLQRIFDPFFTTKEKSRGTGLGLASAYGIINNHGGTITVDSEVGKGTAFNIYLPVSDKQAHQPIPIDDGLMKGSETVLLVDDEQMIIDVGQAMLERLGYHVEVATSGEKAIETVSMMKAELDLVILDMVMPDMDGGQTFDRVRKIQPDMPVMLSSGYAIDGRAAEIISRGCNGFIQKPFNMSELSQLCRKIIDEAKDSSQA